MKKIRVLLIALVLILTGMFFSNSYAAQRTLGAELNRPFTNSRYQFRVEGRMGNNQITDILYTVVKIYDNADKNGNTKLYSKALYCLRGGLGFGADETTDIATAPINYTEFGEMHTDAKNVIEKYNQFYNINLDRTETINGKSVNIYNAILWILDEAYLPVSDTNYNEAEYKRELLDKAGVRREQQEDITKDDIEVIQQLAIWYFTNYDEQKAGTKPTVSQETRFPAQRLLVNGNNNLDGYRLNNLNKIFQYFIDGAINNASSYTIKAGTGERVKQTGENKFNDSLKLEIKKVNHQEIKPNIITPDKYYYEVGPFSIKSETGERVGNQKINLTDIIIYDANGEPIEQYYEINEGSVVEVLEFYDSNNNKVNSLQKGINYYARVKQMFTTGCSFQSPIPADERYDLSNVTLKISSSYTISNATFLIRNRADQPVVEIEKEKAHNSDEITTGDPKEFDLSLRKFITSIKRGDSNIEFGSRVPQINTNTLINGIQNRNGTTEYTATYTHPKNALSVEKGDKVIYTIRVYNEGDIDGTATSVTDYLPEGLKFIPIAESSTNRTYGWTNPSNDGKTIVTDYLRNTTIKAFDKEKTTEESGWQKATTGQGGLYYADLQVECEVIANEAEEALNLRNIAAITEDTGDDRDSNPGDPGREDYTPPADNSTYKEDDDDYEDLILKEGMFDLSLRKFITSIKRGDANIEFESRVPQINTNTLINGIQNRNGTTEYTATYTHPKNALAVEAGDRVIYTIRVYNEGDIDGTATSVTDYLPEGLKFIPIAESSTNRTYGWTNPSNDGKTIVTDYLRNTTIKAFDKEKTTEESGWQKATTGQGGLYYADLQVECEVIASTTGETLNLRNIAAITEDTGDDRDSNPGDPGREDYTPPADNSTYKEDDDDYENLILPGKDFDLSLRKYITKIERDGQNIEILNERNLTNIDTTKLISKENTTAEYKHRKDPIEVQVNDIVTYEFKVYNEGDIDGYVYSIIDYLPEGLIFDKEANAKFIEYKENYSQEEISGKEYAYKIEGNKITILPILEEKICELKAFDNQTLDSKSIDVKFRVDVEESNKDKILTNIATMAYGAKGANIADRDSAAENFVVPTNEELIRDLPGYKGNDSNKNILTDSEYHYLGREDDDDFEKIIIKGKEFDLSLRKYISSINGKDLKTSRVPQLDTSKLNTIDEATGKKITTATYIHPKDPVTVKKGDIVTYKIRIYNEGERDGYATKVTDYLPEGLGFLYTASGEINSDWFLSEEVETTSLYGTDGIYKDEESVLKKDAYTKAFGENIDLSTIQVIQGSKNEDGTRNMLPITAGGTIGEIKIKATDLIKAHVADTTDVTEEDLWQQSINSETDGLFYQELEISCIVLKENTYQGILKNVAEITAAEDSEGNEIINIGDDRDSEPNNVYSDQIHTPETEVNGYTPGEQDDDDFEPLQLKTFDLALRKFITSIETNGKTENITSRIPNPKMGEDGNIVYEHSKEPVYVATNDVVIYTIRVYNEGTIAGYAEEITDDIPEGLEYLPDHNTNKQYNWIMIDKEGKTTEKVEEAVKITTDYLSEAKNKEENLLKPFDSSKAISNEEPLNPDYRDVKVAFKVVEPNTSDRIIINSAQISEDSDDDEDSMPDEWNDGEDDQDKEYIYVKYFDLSLLKWVTKTIVTVDGKTTITETGFEPNTGKTETTGIRDNNEAEPIAKVELDRKKLDKTTVKFAYKIRVTNESEIAGYASEITDFIPEGLEFKEEDNKAYGWVKEGDNKVTTRALETKLLQPGESAEVEIVFTWKKDTNNLGLKTNIAEITEDYNENNSEDIDSVPDNKQDPYEKEQEDDDDFALVILSIKTGKGASYVVFITAMLTLLASGIYLVKKYVLTY